MIFGQYREIKSPWIICHVKINPVKVSISLFEFISLKLKQVIKTASDRGFPFFLTQNC